jgi:hypothetical protein
MSARQSSAKAAPRTCAETSTANGGRREDAAVLAAEPRLLLRWRRLLLHDDLRLLRLLRLVLLRGQRRAVLHGRRVLL